MAPLDCVSLSLFLLVLAWQWTPYYGMEEIFSAMVHMKRLESSQHAILGFVEQYLEIESKRLREMQETLDSIRQDLPPVSVIPQEDAVMHPVHAYHLIQKWHRLLSRVDERIAEGELKKDFFNTGLPLLKNQDSLGATDAILRLQKVYNISAFDLARGHIYGHEAEPMTPDEMKSFGSHALRNAHYELCIDWLKEALAVEPRTSNHSTQYIEMSRAYFMLGNSTQAIENAETAIELDPNNRVYTGYLESYKRHLESGSPVYTTPQFGEGRRLVTYRYEKLCRGEHTVEPSEYLSRNNFCRYRTTSLPYMIFKEEVLSADPWISLIYDVISDEEIQQVKEMAIPKLERANVGDPAKSAITRERVGKVGWLWDTQYGGMVQQLSDRVGLITGLSTTYRPKLSSAEAFQVVNYGLGGQYETHHDFYENTKLYDNLPPHLRHTGDRMATFMFYLSDVIAGGATVFPSINIRVPAVKNAAAFWYNVRKSGDKDFRTDHAGCPVLLGEKWVANKWIREYDQHFRRPCGLEHGAGEDYVL